jgi:uncharacterized protein
VVVEEGSALVAELWATPHRTASSMLSHPEGRAALAAARRGGCLSARAHSRAREELESAHAELLLIGIDEPLVRVAGQLAEDLGLRGYDAVHLASVLALGADTTIVTWDQELGQAAMQSGCPVAPAVSRAR